jgi:multicomponent Na+:H+ antiporter subunit D
MGAMITIATPAADWIIILPVVLALVGAAILLMLRKAQMFHAGFAMMVAAAIFLCDVQLVARVLAEGPVSMTMGKWLPPFGISFAADILGAGFALAAAGVTLIVLVYAQSERSGMDGRDGFYPLVLLLLGGVSGAFLTGDLFNLYVWFEVLLIASFGLIVLGGRSVEIDGAVKYGFLNFLATTIFLAALGLLYGLVGTLNMADIVGSARAANPAALTAVAGLFMLAFGIKAAAFPVNAWLPASYHTPPASVSALFAGLLTKVGVYALMRVLIALLPASRDLLDPAITAIAIATLVLAPLGAIAETNLRRALGFLVIGGIGMVIAGLSLPSLRGITGSSLYVFHAILTMSGLYLVAGLIERVTGETDSRAMGGVYGAQSVISVLFLILILGVAGMPPFLGFWPKLLLLQASIEGGNLAFPQSGYGYRDLAVAAAILINAVLTLIAGSRLWAHIFWRTGPEGAQSEHRNERLRALGVREDWFGLTATSVLVAVIVVAGLWPQPLFEAGLAAATDLMQPGRYISAVGLGGAP